jgi:thioesterase domain-containing protein
MQRYNPRIKVRWYNGHLASRYSPTKYEGEVLLFMPERRLGQANDPSIRLKLWDGLLEGQLTVHVIPGIHIQILREPFVKELAPILKDYLRNVE